MSLSTAGRDLGRCAPGLGRPRWGPASRDRRRAGRVSRSGGCNTKGTGVIVSLSGAGRDFGRCAPGPGRPRCGPAAETVSETVPECCWAVSGAQSATGALFIASRAVRIGPTPRHPSPPPPPRHPAYPPSPPRPARPFRPPSHPQSRSLLPLVPAKKKVFCGQIPPPATNTLWIAARPPLLLLFGGDVL